MADGVGPAAQRRAAQVLTATLEAAELPANRVAEWQWMTMLTGEFKRTIPVVVRVGHRSVRVSSLLAGRPDEQLDEVHSHLLHRNQEARWVHYALDDAGDIILTGRVVHAAWSGEVCGEVLGEVLLVQDAAFNGVLRMGFATYIEVEQRWRAANGLPPNPVSTHG